MKRFGRKKEFTTTRIMAVGFFVAIVIGTFLLMLPLSSKTGKVTGIVDALFTSTTSVCVTGLVTVPTYAHWSLFGQVVIALLAQVGGLGVIYVIHDVYVDSASPDWHERKTFDSGCV